MKFARNYRLAGIAFASAVALILGYPLSAEAMEHDPSADNGSEQVLLESAQSLAETSQSDSSLSEESVDGFAQSDSADEAVTGTLFASEIQIIDLGGETVSFRLRNKNGNGFIPEVLSDGRVRWSSTKGAVGLRVTGQIDYQYVPYGEVNTVRGSVVASAQLVSPNGSRILVEDTFGVDGDTLTIDRSFQVETVAADDTEGGFSLSFAMSDNAAKLADSYEWFAPGTWYGNSSNDSFTKLNNMAFNGDLTSMGVDNLGAPVIAAFDSEQESWVSLADRSPGDAETVSADREPQTTKTIIDDRFSLAGLGVRRSISGGTEMFQSFPAWTKNYRNRYNNAEINRFLPLTEGQSGQTVIEISGGKAKDLGDTIEQVWTAAYDDLAQIIDRFDTQVHFNTLVDYLDDSYGIEDGRPQYMIHYDHHNATSGFLHRNADVGWILLAQGHERSDEGMVDRARTVISDQVANGGLDHSNNPRSTAEAHASVLRAYVVDKEQGVEQDEWLAKVRSWADSLPDTATIYAVAPLIQLSQVTGDSKYREAAIRAADDAWSSSHVRWRFFGSLEDYAGGAAEHDREAAYLALEAYNALATTASTDEEKSHNWVARAERAALIAATWQRIDDLEMVPDDADESLIMCGNEDIQPFGISVIHAGSNAGDQYGALMAPEYYTLYELTGNTRYQEFAVYLEKNSILYTNLGDKAGWMADALKGSGLGFTNEYLGSGANDYWDNNRRGDGHDSNLGWTSYVLAAMTQRTLDLYGRYSLTSPSQSDIGLDAYYQIVNRATGQVLSVEGSRENDSSITTVGADANDRSSQWLLQNLDGADVKLVNRDSGKVLNASNCAVGALLQQSIYMPGQSVEVSFQSSKEGFAELSLCGYSLEASAEGAGVHLAESTGFDYQQWQLVPVGDIRLREIGTDQVLTSNASGETALTTLDDDATLAQRWSVIKLDSGYLVFVSRSSAGVLTANSEGTVVRGNGSSQVVAGVGVTDEGYALNQQWSLTWTDDHKVRLTSRDGAVTVDYQLQTAGPATTFTPASLVAAQAVQGVAEVGKTLTLPDNVTAILSDGETMEVSVAWPEFSVDSAPGTYRVFGQIAGTQVRAPATVVYLPAGGIVSFDETRVQTNVGEVPTLPSVVVGYDSNGKSYTLPVAWNDFDPSLLEEVGEITLTGTVNGVSAKATLRIEITDAVAKEVDSARDVRVTTVAGELPALPLTVQVEYVDGSVGIEAVQWQSVTEDQVSEPGYVLVTGEARGAAVTCYVTVATFYDDFTEGTMDRWSVGGQADYTVSNSIASTPQPEWGKSQWAFANDESSEPLVFSDGVVEARVRIDSDQNGGIWLRAPDSSDQGGYYLGIEGHTNNATAGFQIGGNWTQWVYGPSATEKGEFAVLRIVADGGSLKGFINGNEIPFFSQTDTAFSAGQLGIRSWSAGMSVDYFLVAPLPTVISADEVSVTTTAGSPASLPGTVTFTYSDGSRSESAVTWDTSEVDWSQPGTIQIAGRSAEGFEASAAVVVQETRTIESATNQLIVVAPGETPELPNRVPVAFSDGTTDTAEVQWDDPSDFPLESGQSVVWGVVRDSSVNVAAVIVVSTYEVDFTQSCAVSDWEEFSGSWSCDESGYRVSDFGWSGAKSVSTSVEAADMVYQGTIKLDGSGQAGLIFRVTNQSVGADSYRGYYAGVNSGTGSVTLGRANGSWTELASSSLAAPIKVGESVDIRVIAVGNRIRVCVGDMNEAAIDYVDASSVVSSTGRIGIRGYHTSYTAMELSVAPVPEPISVETVRVSTVRGVLPTLPATVATTEWDGSSGVRSVTWDLADWDSRSQLRTDPILVEGAVSGRSDPVYAEVTVTAAVLTSVVPSEVSTTAGVLPTLPETVLAYFSDGLTAQVPVSEWENVDAQWVAEPTTFEVTGELAAQTSLRARAEVVVGDAENPETPGGETPGGEGSQSGAEGGNSGTEIPDGGAAGGSDSDGSTGNASAAGGGDESADSAEPGGLSATGSVVVTSVLFSLILLVLGAALRRVRRA